MHNTDESGRIQRVGTSRTYCQNRVEIAHLKSGTQHTPPPTHTHTPLLKTRNNGGPPPSPLKMKLNIVEHSWIRPCDVFEFKFLVQFIGRV
jgi:hypothetical protein